jgi:hypothetical protein
MYIVASSRWSVRSALTPAGCPCFTSQLTYTVVNEMNEMSVNEVSQKVK